MPEINEPRLDQWYLRRDTGERFLVTDYDEDSATVEIQAENGDLDELDREVWEALPLQFADAPQDWAAPLDTLLPEDREGVETDSDSEWPSDSERPQGQRGDRGD